MLTFIFVLATFRENIGDRVSFGNKKVNEKSKDKILQNLWDFLTSSFTRNDVSDTKWWYLNGSQRFCGSFYLSNKYLIQISALILLPLWTIIGVLTLGLAWPPQVRIWLFRSSLLADEMQENSLSNERSSINEPMRNEDIRKDIGELKYMTYERISELQDEIQRIRDDCIEFTTK